MEHLHSPQEDSEAGQPTEPLIIRYTTLLHQYRDPAAKEVQDFLRTHSGDTVFVKRAAVLNKMFKLKAELGGF